MTISNNWANVVERAWWAGVNAGLAMLGFDSLVDTIAIPTRDKLIMAALAAAISMIKTVSQERSAALKG